MNDFKHITVLADEFVDGLNLKSGAICVDCTAGGGGHTKLMANLVLPGGKVFAIDQDDLAIKTLENKFSENISDGQVVICKGRFSEIESLTKELGVFGKVNGIGADLGVSSPQLDLAERGFSFSHDGPLDMRMDQNSSERSAKDVVAEESMESLKLIFRKYGEEPKAHFIAQAICKYREDREITTTAQLAKIVDDAVHYSKKSKKHPATRTFQALRIYVNKELEELENLLKFGFEALAPGGRLGIISFHSLEDKLVKYAFREFAKDPQSMLPKGLPITSEELAKMGSSRGKIIRPFPVNATDEEIAANPRSRSAKLRIIEKL